MDFPHSRRAELLRAADGEADAHLVFHRPNVRYLTGLDAADAVLVSAKGSLALCDERLAKRCRTRATDLTPFPRATGVSLFESAAEAIKQVGAKSVAVEAEHLSAAALGRLTGMTKATLRPVSNRVEGLRAVKDTSEVEAIKLATRVAGRGLLMLRAVAREADHEVELGRQLDTLLYRAGADSLAFPSEVFLGDTAADPLPTPRTDLFIGECSKLYAYAAPRKGGYCGVIARTDRSPLHVPPLRKTKSERTLFKYSMVATTVQAATRAAVGAVGPTATAGSVAAAAHKVYTSAGFAKYAALEVGHGVGLDPREGPFLRPDDTTPLPAGTVLLVCPKLIIPEWGVMVEGVTVVVTREGSVDLGTATHAAAVPDDADDE